MKSFTMLCSMFLSVSLAACGGEDDGNGGGGDGNAITITDVLGNGSGEGIFRDALIVVGENFSEGMEVTLAANTLSYDLDSATRITARLPEDLTPGDYELKVADATSSATHAVTILQGEAGLSIESSLFINPYPEDLCTEYIGDECYFGGGQFVKFADGTVLFTGSFVFAYTDGVSDTDTNEYAVTVIVTPDMDVAWQRLSEFVARGTGYQALLQVYVRDPEGMALVHDTNGNLEIDEADELIATLTLE